MHAKTALVAGFLAALQPASADFRVFFGAQNSFAAGGQPGAITGLTPQAWFFNNAPDCDDDGAVLTGDPNNDVSWGGGFVCDGCKDAPPVPDRVEVHDKYGPYFDNAGDEPHFTIYKDENKEGNYNIVDLDGNNIGTCTIPKDRQDYTCGRGPWVADSGTETFRCTSKISVKNSN